MLTYLLTYLFTDSLTFLLTHLLPDLPTYSPNDPVTGCFCFVYYDSKNCKSSKGYIKFISMIEKNEAPQTVPSLY